MPDRTVKRSSVPVSRPKVRPSSFQVDAVTLQHLQFLAWVRGNALGNPATVRATLQAVVEEAAWAAAANLSFAPTENGK